MYTFISPWTARPLDYSFSGFRTPWQLPKPVKPGIYLFKLLMASLAPNYDAFHLSSSSQDVCWILRNFIGFTFRALTEFFGSTSSGQCWLWEGNQGIKKHLRQLLTVHGRPVRVERWLTFRTLTLKAWSRHTRFWRPTRATALGARLCDRTE